MSYSKVCVENSDFAVSPKGKILPLREKPLVAILDDEPTIIELYGTVLDSLGYDTVGFQYKDECFCQLRNLLPDVIISDIYAPRMNGLDFLLSLKADFRFKHIPVIIVSGQMHHHEVEAKRRGALACYSKPLDPGTLIRIVQYALDQ